MALTSISQSGAEIVCADFTEFLAGLERGAVDLVLTDPPYTISRETGFKNAKNGVDRLAVSMDFGEWDHTQIDLAKFSELSFRCLRRGGTLITWYDVWKITALSQAMKEAGFKMIRLVVWNKTNPVPLNSSATYLSNGREIAVSGVKGGSPTFHSKYDTGDYREPIPRHGGKRLHPTQKPLSIFQDLVRKHSNPGDLVADPFMGSGTTAVAAYLEDRLYAGCDIDPSYVSAANNRLEELRQDADEPQLRFA